ncbi:MAG TPA: hypothetical protein DIW27_12435 [Cytophagales bacterium]|nr:hypothetical protein [Cytophagales bacterium]
MEEQIINKVAQSGIITLDLEEFAHQGEFKVVDLKDFMFMGEILREKDFRQKLEETDWSQYRNAAVAIQWPHDTIIQKWAFMLLASKLTPFTLQIHCCQLEELPTLSLLQNIRDNINPADYKDKRVVVKGCGEMEIPDKAYLLISQMLLPSVKSLMFGEACSTVPVFKKSK